MLKFLIVLGVIWVLARLAKRWIVAKALRRQQDLMAQMQAQMSGQMPDAAGSPAAAGARPEAQASGGGAERMVACAHCGLHIPQSEVLVQGSLVFCSAEHAQAAQA